MEDIRLLKKQVAHLSNQVLCLLATLPAATIWTPDHNVAFGNKYAKDTLVWHNGFIYKCLVANSGANITNTYYWQNIGPGWMLDQEQADWNATSGPSAIRNKPVGLGGPESDPVFTAWLATNPLAPYYLASNPAGYITSADIPTNLSEFTNDVGFLTQIVADAIYAPISHTHSFASLTGKPTTLAGYGITDAYPLVGNPSNFLTTILGLNISLLNNDSGYITSSALAPYLPLAGGTMSGQIVQPLAPVGAFDLANKNYIDNLITGITWKNSVRAATTANITLSGTQTIDGVSLVIGNRVLVKNQTTTSENGIYVVSAGAWTRATDCDSASELESTTVLVMSGTANKNTQWTESLTISTIGTDPVTFVQIAGAGVYTNGSGITLTGNVFSIAALAIVDSMINSVSWSKISGTPTTLAGYGITDAYPLLSNPAGYITSSALAPYLLSATAASTYFPIPTGTTAQYIRGNGSLATFPVNVSAFTNDSGYLTSATGVPSGRTITINGVTFDLSANRTWSVGDALVASGLLQFAPITSAQLASLITDETGSAGGGLAVFSNSPTVATPAFLGKVTINGAGLVGTSGTAILDAIATFNNAAGTFKAISVAVTNTASNNASTLVDISVNGQNAFSINVLRSVTIGNQLTVGGSAFVGQSSAIGFSSRSFMDSPANGNLRMTNAAGTGFSLLIFGVASSSFPALKVNGTGLDLRLADDSAYTGFTSLYQRFGTGSPEGVITAPIGTIYHRTNGGAATSLYIKESGTGNTGWVALMTAGSVKTGTLSKTANYTVLATDYGNNGNLTLFVDASAGSATITLLAAASSIGLRTNVIKTDSSANAVIVKGSGAELINASNTFNLISQYQKIGTESNGTQNYILL